MSDLANLKVLAFRLEAQNTINDVLLKELQSEILKLEAADEAS